jgi:hypothetical protein
MSFFHELEKILADLSSNVPFFLYPESNHHDSLFPPVADSGTRHNARDMIETCRCRSLYIRFCYFVPKSTSHHLYAF